MKTEKITEYLNRLKSEITPALGCTEPAAAALAAAYAAAQLESPPQTIRLEVSEYIFKNGMNVGIPGTGMLGLPVAAALGAVSAQPEKELMVLTGLSARQKEDAVRLVGEQKVEILLAQTAEKVFINATVSDGIHTARAVISGVHTHLSLLEKDGVCLCRAEPATASGNSGTAEPYTVTLSEITQFVNAVDDGDLSFLSEVIRLNQAIAQEGLTHDYGLKVGKSLMENNSRGLLSIDVGSYAVACTAAAADARMAGCDKPVMSTAGSGNQGLTASIPVTAVGEKLGKSPSMIIRSLALSILVTLHAKHYIGRLSVLCGCSIAAAIGTCCGVIYLLGGSVEQMTYGINSMVADISGVVCDGAKPGCALKIATAVSSAIRAASMAVCGLGADSHDGIVTMDVEQTLANLGILGNQGMSNTNAAILGMMMDKQR